jgi:hypothetical protein
MYTSQSVLNNICKENQSFLWSYDSASRLPPSLLSPVQVVSLSQSSCVSTDELTDGGEGEGVGEEPNNKTARKPSPL